MFTENLQDIICLDKIVNDSEMEYNEIIESYPTEVLEEYVSYLRGNVLTIPEKDFVEKFNNCF